MTPLTPEEVKIRIVEKIKKGISDMRLQKKEFAKLMGVQPSVITKWLKGDQNFQVKTLFEMERILGIELFNIYNNEQSGKCTRQ